MFTKDHTKYNMATTATVLPKELRLAAPPTMPQARSYMFKQQSTQHKYSMGETITINIPRLQRSYLSKDSFLKFTVSNAWTPGTNKYYTGAAGQADNSAKFPLVFDTPGALGLIDRIEVYDYCGSTLLESISGHGQLAALLMDLSTNFYEHKTHYEVTTGTNPVPNVAWQQGHDNQTRCVSHFYNGTGENLTSGGFGWVWHDVANENAGIVTREFSIPLFSFLGLLSTKYAPLHNGYTLQITLNRQADAFGMTDESKITDQADERPGSAVTDVTTEIYDVSMCCQVLELGPVAEQMLLASTGNLPLVIPTKSYRNFVGSLSAASNNFKLDLNLNVASLTNLLLIMRPTSQLNKMQMRTLSNRIRNYLQSWYFQYGSSILPQTSGIQCRSKTTTPELTDGTYYFDHSEAYIELLKARHAFNVPNHNTLIDTKTYTKDVVTDTSNLLTVSNPYPGGKFALGLDLELVSGRSNDMICGMNTNGLSTSIHLTFDSSNVNNVVASRVDAWCEYDAFINVAPGIATTVSF